MHWIHTLIYVNMGARKSPLFSTIEASKCRQFLASWNIWVIGQVILIPQNSVPMTQRCCVNQKQYRVNLLASFSPFLLLFLCVWLPPSFTKSHNCFRTLWIRSWIQRWGVIIGFAANMLSCVALTVRSCPQGYTLRFIYRIHALRKGDIQ